jgi:MFS family permease
MGKTSKIFYGYFIVMASLVIIIASHCLPFSFGIFFKPMIAEFAWTRAATSGAFSLSRVVSGIISVFIGGLNDKYGPRLVVTVCGLSSILGCWLLSQINTLDQFYLVYGVILAIGPSIFVAIASTIARWFVKRRSVMTGVVAAGLGVSTLIGAPVADFLISKYDWRTAYFILGIAVTTLVVLFAQLLKRDPAKMDLDPYGKDNRIGGELKAFNQAYTLREAIQTRQFWLFFGCSICFAFCLLAIMVHTVPYITDKGISSMIAANVLATVGAVTIVSMIAMGRLADKLGNKKTQVLGFSLLSVALIVLMVSKELWEFYLFAVLFGIAWGGIGVPRSPIVAEMFGLRAHGLIFGVVDNSYTIGGAIGPIVTGYIFDLSGSYQYAFLLAFVISITGLLLTIILNPSLAKISNDIAR